MLYRRPPMIRRNLSKNCNSDVQKFAQRLVLRLRCCRQHRQRSVSWTVSEPAGSQLVPAPRTHCWPSAPLTRRCSKKPRPCDNFSLEHTHHWRVAPEQSAFRARRPLCFHPALPSPHANAAWSSDRCALRLGRPTKIIESLLWHGAQSEREDAGEGPPLSSRKRFYIDASYRHRYPTSVEKPSPPLHPPRCVNGYHHSTPSLPPLRHLNPSLRNFTLPFSRSQPHPSHVFLLRATLLLPGFRHATHIRHLLPRRSRAL